ncbi:hypothetical protein DBR27_19325, partial [Flavobacterium sp. HMWF030]
MKEKFKSLTVLFFVLVMQFMYAQDRKISGVVSDVSGVIPNVNVLVRGSKNAVQSNIDGKYIIQAKTGDVLIFSYMGMKEVLVTITSSDVVNVKMKEDGKDLEEVIVVAYGKQKLKSIVGAVGIVSSDVIEKQQNVNVLNALQGSV